MDNNPRILIIGYGNPGRQDDALGVELAEKIKKWSEKEGYTNIEVDTNYQLNIEDTTSISDKDLVIFVDASREEIDNYLLTPLQSSAKVDFTMHHVSPGYILYLCREIYDRIPEAHLLHIKGYEWEFLAEMTPKAISNLNKAYIHLQTYLSDYISSVRT